MHQSSAPEGSAEPENSQGMNDPCFSAIDLFSGCGGLSLGLRRAGFRVAAAVELHSRAANTYSRNHPGTQVLIRDLRSVSGEQLQAATGCEKVSLVVGCAPCQGFCSLTSKYSREDERNGLLMEMARIVRELQPDAVMMENVPGLASRGKVIFSNFMEALEEEGYLPEARIVQMANYGVPQYRRRLVTLAGKGFRIPFPACTHARLPKPGSQQVPWVTVRSAIHEMSPPLKLSEARKNGGPRKNNWHVVRDLQPQTKARLKAAQPGKTWLEVEERLRPKCHRDGYKGFTNVYGRMKWDDVSVTITGGCTTPCKGRFGHPDRRRTTISVREAALLQTFPESYVFECDFIDEVCEMIGNAVPPLFAECIGIEIRKALEERYESVAGES